MTSVINEKNKKQKPSVHSLLDRAIWFHFTSSSFDLMIKIISHWTCWMYFRFSTCLFGEPGPAVWEVWSCPGALTHKRRTPWSWWSPRIGSSAAEHLSRSLDGQNGGELRISKMEFYNWDLPLSSGVIQCIHGYMEYSHLFVSQHCVYPLLIQQCLQASGLISFKGWWGQENT